MIRVNIGNHSDIGVIVQKSMAVLTGLDIHYSIPIYTDIFTIKCLHQCPRNSRCFGTSIV